MSVEHQQAKQAVIDEIRGKLDRAQSAVVIDYIGITVEEADNMRRKLRDANVDYKVYKNTLASRAIKGTKYEELDQVLSGPSAFALSYEDAVAPARVLAGIIKEFNKMSFKAGVIEGSYFDADGVKSIAALPTRDEMIAKFLGSIQSPLSKFVRTLQAIADDKAEGKPQEAAPEEAAAAEAVTEAPKETATEAASATEAPAEAEAAPAAETSAEAAPSEAAAEVAPAETPETSAE